MGSDESTTPNAPTAREAGAEELRIDALLADFQLSCELVGMAEHGDWDCSETTKHRAILRNELRSALLAARREVERANARIAGHEAIFRWLQGEEGEFPESVPGKRYNFRTELSRRLAALAATQERDTR